MLSPGPANLAAFAVASRWNGKQAAPFLLGIAVIYALVAILATTLGARLIGSLGGLRIVWQVLGGLFIAYLGWRLAGRRRSNQTEVFAPSFASGVVLQLLNPKYPAVVLAVLANRPDERPLTTAAVIASVGCVGLVSYAALGTTTRHAGTSAGADRWIDRALGGLLIATGMWLAIAAIWPE